MSNNGFKIPYFHPLICNKLLKLSLSSIHVFNLIAYSTNGGIRPYFLKRKEVTLKLCLSKASFYRSMHELLEANLIEEFAAGRYNISYQLRSEVSQDTKREVAGVVVNAKTYVDPDTGKEYKLMLDVSLDYDNKTTPWFQVSASNYQEWSTHMMSNFVVACPFLDDVEKKRLCDVTISIQKKKDEQLQEDLNKKICLPKKKALAGNSKQREKSSSTNTSTTRARIDTSSSLNDVLNYLEAPEQPIQRKKKKKAVVQEEDDIVDEI